MYYWRTIIGDYQLLDEHSEALEKLLSGTYASGDLEQLHGHRDIFSYRLNKKERLLFTIIKRNEENHLLVLEYLPTHDYDKSRFLKSGVLRHYLAKHHVNFAADIARFEAIQRLPVELVNDNQPIALDYHHQQFIQLSPIQEQALSMTLPAIISGVAGSGKSCVAMTLLSQAVERCINSEAAHLLYVAESDALVNHMQQAFHELPLANYLPEGLSIRFLTINALAASSSSQRFDLVLVDEAQDLSSQQLEMLANASIAEQIVYCLDNHQNLRDASSKATDIGTMLYRRLGSERPVSRIMLPKTYRCPIKIARAADALIKMKYQLTGGRLDNQEVATIDLNLEHEAGTGHLLVLDKERVTGWLWLQEQATGVNFAVIADKSLVGEAAHYFPAERIFTPSEIKGLEYDTIVLYRPFSTKTMQNLAKQLSSSTLDLNSEREIHRPKKGVGNMALAPNFNQWITAVTRAKRVLVVCEEHTRETRIFLTPLTVIMADSNVKDAESEQQKTTLDDWLKEMYNLLHYQQDSKAFAIYHRHINPGASFEEFTRDIMPSRKAVAAATPVIKPLLSSSSSSSSSSAEIPRVQHKKKHKKLKQTVVSHQDKVAIIPLKKEKDSLPPMHGITSKVLAIFLNKEIHNAKEFVVILNILINHSGNDFRIIKRDFLEPISIKGQSLLDVINQNHIAMNHFLEWFSCQKTEIKHLVMPLFIALDPSRLFSIAPQSYLLILHSLMAMGYALDFVDAQGFNLLHCAARWGRLEAVNFLVRAGLDINRIDNAGQPPVYMAVVGGHLDVLNKFILHGADLTKVNNNGESLTFVAAAFGHVAIVKRLQQLHHDTSKPNRDGYTPVHIAAEHGHVAIIQLFDGPILSQVDTQGDTPAHIAAYKGHADVIRCLGERGARLNEKNNNGIIPAFMAVARGHLAIVNLLRLFGVELCQIDTFGRNLAHIATIYGHGHLLECLHQCGVNLNKRDHFNETPADMAAKRSDLTSLIILQRLGIDTNHTHQFLDSNLASKAAAEGCLDTLQCLELCGVDLTKKDSNGSSLAFVAGIAGQQDVLEFLAAKGIDLYQENNFGFRPDHYAACNNQVSTLKYLYDKGYQLDILASNGLNVLHCAAENGASTVIRFLITLDFNLDQKTADSGDTPSHMAVFRQHYDVLAMLIKAGANINAVNYQGMTPAHFAANDSHSKGIKYLIESGADVTIPDSNGTTPLMIAIAKGHRELLLTLYGITCQIKEGSEPPEFLLDAASRALIHETVKSGDSRKLQLFQQLGINLEDLSVKQYDPRFFRANHVAPLAKSDSLLYMLK